MRPIVRSVLVVLAGYLVLAVGIGVLDFILSRISPNQYPSGPEPAAKWMIVELAVGTALVVCGGYLTAALASQKQTRHALALGILTSGLAAVSLAIYHNVQPFWFQLVMVIAAIPAALAGGFLKVRR
jgi:hypothetical protein